MSSHLIVTSIALTTAAMRSRREGFQPSGQKDIEKGVRTWNWALLW